jgi:hypothetical protein
MRTIIQDAIGMATYIVILTLYLAASFMITSASSPSVAFIFLCITIIVFLYKISMYASNRLAGKVCNRGFWNPRWTRKKCNEFATDPGERITYLWASTGGNGVRPHVMMCLARAGCRVWFHLVPRPIRTSSSSARLVTSFIHLE